MVMEGDLTWGGAHTIQCTDDILCTCTPETYMILLTNVTPTNSINKESIFYTLHSGIRARLEAGKTELKSWLCH